MSDETNRLRETIRVMAEENNAVRGALVAERDAVLAESAALRSHMEALANEWERRPQNRLHAADLRRALSGGPADTAQDTEPRIALPPSTLYQASAVRYPTDEALAAETADAIVAAGAGTEPDTEPRCDRCGRAQWMDFRTHRDCKHCGNVITPRGAAEGPQPDPPRLINGTPHPRVAVHPPDRRCEDYCAAPTTENGDPRA